MSHKPAWLAQVTDVTTPELTAAIREAEQQGIPDIITNLQVVGLALQAVAEAM